MANDSDTESEPESSLPKYTATEFVAAHNVRNSQESIDANSAGIAIQTLKSLDLGLVQRVRIV